MQKDIVAAAIEDIRLMPWQCRGNWSWYKEFKIRIKNAVWRFCILNVIQKVAIIRQHYHIERPIFWQRDNKFTFFPLSRRCSTREFWKKYPIFVLLSDILRVVGSISEIISSMSGGASLYLRYLDGPLGSMQLFRDNAAVPAASE